MKEKLIYPPTVQSWNWDRLPDGTEDPRHGEVCREIPYSCYLELVGVQLPRKVRSYASAPGTGHVDTMITRVDETGAYGYVLENTVRELQEWEVR